MVHVLHVVSIDCHRQRPGARAEAHRPRGRYEDVHDECRGRDGSVRATDGAAAA